MTGDAFEDFVRQWLIDALAGSTAEFFDLVRQSPGIAPELLLEAAKGLPLKVASRINWNKTPTRFEPPDGRFPVPHPLDFDWRFSRSTIDSLTSELLPRLEHGIALLGAPSLWIRLTTAHKTRPSPMLWDANAQYKHGSSDSVIAVDLCSQIANPDPFRETVGTVVADPPWYPDATRCFLWMASQLTHVGGTVVLSGARVGTRPGVADERESIGRWAEGLGLHLTEIREGAVRYAMPPFERNSLRARQLLQFVPFDWRTGDLLVFRQGRRPAPVPHPGAPAPSDDVWAERIVRGVRIRVRIDHPEATSGGCKLVSLVDGDIIRSVSRREPLRESVRVWTSGNRVFGCNSPRALLHALDQLMAGRVTDGTAPGICQSIENLVEQERKEYIDPNDA